MSGFCLDFIFKKAVLYIMEAILVISALFIGEKLIVEYITKKIVKGCYTTIFLTLLVSRNSIAFSINQVLLLVLYGLIILFWYNIIANLLFVF